MCFREGCQSQARSATWLAARAHARRGARWSSLARTALAIAGSRTARTGKARHLGPRGKTARSRRSAPITRLVHIQHPVAWLRHDHRAVCHARPLLPLGHRRRPVRRRIPETGRAARRQGLPAAGQLPRRRAGAPSVSARRLRRGGRRTPGPSGRRSGGCRTAARRGRWPPRPCRRSGRLTAAARRRTAPRIVPRSPSAVPRRAVWQSSRTIPVRVCLPPQSRSGRPVAPMETLAGALARNPGRLGLACLAQKTRIGHVTARPDRGTNRLARRPDLYIGRAERA